MTKKTIIHIDPGDYTTFKDWEPKHYGNWATPFSEQTLKYSRDYKIEIWMDYVTSHYGQNGISVRERNGIIFKQFPAVSFSHKRIFSFKMLQHLRKRINSGEQILVHLQNLHRIEINLLALFCKKIAA